MNFLQKIFFIFFTLFTQNIFSAMDSSQMLRRRVLILGLDGTTGNQFHQVVWTDNKAPALRNLLSAGIFTHCTHDRDQRCARTHGGHKSGDEYFWLTGPGWASVLTGLNNFRHKVKDNEHESLKAFALTTREFPTFMSTARIHGLKTAAAGVSAFITSYQEDTTLNGIIDYECGALSEGPNVKPNAKKSCNLDYRTSLNAKDANRDIKLTNWYVEQIKKFDSDIIMGVYDKIDSSGHSNGFDSNSSYLKAISATDKLISKVLAAVAESSKDKNEEWLVVLTSDHGGHRILGWGMHGSTENEDEVIPFAISLIGSEKKLKPLRYPVTHMDVFPTVMHWLGISHKKRDGRVQGL